MVVILLLNVMEVLSVGGGALLDIPCMVFILGYIVFVCHQNYVCDKNAGVGDEGGVVGLSAGHEYVGGTRGSGVVFSAADVLGMSVVRGMKGVGGVCVWLGAV